jgi:hypothetical protein
MSVYPFDLDESYPISAGFAHCCARAASCGLCGRPMNGAAGISDGETTNGGASRFSLKSHRGGSGKSEVGDRLLQTVGGLLVHGPTPPDVLIRLLGCLDNSPTIKSANS